MKEMQRPPYRRTIFVCCRDRDPGEDACGNRGSARLAEILKQYVAEHGLKGRIRVSKTMCLDLCRIGPNVCIQPDNVWYNGVGEADLPELIERWIRPIETERDRRAAESERDPSRA